MLQEWWWCLSHSIFDFLGLWWYSNFPPWNWYGPIHVTWWHWSMGIGSLFQRHWMGIIGHRILAECLLHCYFGLEFILSFPVIQVCFKPSWLLTPIWPKVIWPLSQSIFSKVLPWSVCSNWWNSECCTVEMGMNNETGKQALIKPETCPENATATYPEEEYWK